MNNNENVLTIKNLTVAFEDDSGSAAVKGVDLSLHRGEILALVGESGCGKTVLCKSILGILCEKGRVRSGEILLDGTDLLTLTEKQLQKYRGSRISMVFQDPMISLNPTICVGEQIAESVRLCRGLGKKAAAAETVKLMEQVGIPQAEERYRQMPHHFSGGMRQRVAIAIALAGEPDILLADEPTTALDIGVQEQILALLKRIQEERGNTIVFITHDLGLARDLADRTAVMQGGRIVEIGDTEEIFENPQHEYTKRLLSYADYGKGTGHSHGKYFTDGGRTQGVFAKQNDVNCQTFAAERTVENKHQYVESRQKKLIEIRDLSKYFKLNKTKTVTAFEHLDMDIYEGELLGIVGPSGCGKSTLARCIMGIYEPSGGTVTYANEDMRDADDRSLPAAQQRNWKQMIFQDSASAFNPRMTVEEIIGEPLLIMNRKKPPRGLILSLMEQAELGAELIGRKPHELSGGQRQRVAIARALSAEPEFIIADEPISSLDVSVQSQIVHLFKKLQTERKLTIMLIAHDLPMVQHVSDRIIELNH